MSVSFSLPRLHLSQPGQTPSGILPGSHLGSMFPSENSVCGHQFTGHTHTYKLLFKHWPLQSRLLFQSCWLRGETQQGPSANPGSIGKGIRTSLCGADWSRAAICLSQKGDWLPAPAPAPLRFSWKPFRLAQLGMLAHQIPGFMKNVNTDLIFHFKWSQAYCSQQMPSDSICPPDFEGN